MLSLRRGAFTESHVLDPSRTSHSVSTHSRTRKCGSRSHKEVHGMSSNQRGPTLAAPSYGVTWGGLPMYARRAMTVGLATLVAAGVAGPATAQAAESSSAEQVSVIVRELPGSGDAPERAIAGYGGEVGRALD